MSAAPNLPLRVPETQIKIITRPGNSCRIVVVNPTESLSPENERSMPIDSEITLEIINKQAQDQATKHAAKALKEGRSVYVAKLMEQVISNGLSGPMGRVSDQI